MVQIESYEQFAELRNNAVRCKKLKLTNYLVPNDELRLHILNGRVFFEETERCLCIVIKIRQYDYLYFWCANENDTFIPTGANNVLLSVFTNSMQNLNWQQTAQNFGLKVRSKILQISGKTSSLEFPEYPGSLRSFKLDITREVSYEHYMTLFAPYFDSENDMLPEKYIWDGVFKDKMKLLEVKNDNGETAAFCSFDTHGKLLECYLLAVDSKYRGQRLHPFIVEHTLNGYDLYKTWVQDWNEKSMKVFKAIGMKETGYYRILYGV